MSVFLVLSSCPNPADQTVKVDGNGMGTSNYFSFNTFQFSGNSGDVYLHCKIELCVKQSNTCAPVLLLSESHEYSTISNLRTLP